MYCVDFGLAKLYRDRKTLDHLPLREGSLAGTPRYDTASGSMYFMADVILVMKFLGGK